MARGADARPLAGLLRRGDQAGAPLAQLPGGRYATERPIAASASSTVKSLMVRTCAVVLPPMVKAAAAASSSGRSHTTNASTSPKAKWKESTLPPSPEHLAGS